MRHVLPQDMYSEKLGIHWHRIKYKRNRWRVGGSSRFYHGLLKAWWDHFGLAGSGLLIGEEGKYGENVKAKLMAEYPDIEEMFSVGLSDSDINCDIQKELPVPRQMDWAICQAVLEHLADPFGSMCNIFDALVVGGMGFFHTVGPGYEYHPYPIDCIRFFRDTFVEWERLAENMVIEDLSWTSKHCFVAYRKV